MHAEFETVRVFVADTVPIDEIELLAVALAFTDREIKQQAIDLSREDLMQKLAIAGADTSAEFERMAVTAFAQLIFETIEILEGAVWGNA